MISPTSTLMCDKLSVKVMINSPIDLKPFEFQCHLNDFYSVSNKEYSSQTSDFVSQSQRTNFLPLCPSLRGDSE